MDTGITVGLIVGVAMIIIKVIDFFITKNKHEDDQKIIKEVRYSKESLMNEIRDIQKTVDETLDMHQKYDADGTPLWYVPRSWASSQEKIVETLSEISHTQKTIANTLEKLEESKKK
jgi:peptidoglycan hydrolase CwlO-like protein